MSFELLWFLIGIGFFGLELLLPGFIVFFFGLGAWVVTATLAWHPLALKWQLLVFLVSSLLSLVLLRQWLKTAFFGEQRSESDSVNVAMQPTLAEVTRAIRPPARGQVRFGGTFWQAEAEVPIEEGTMVEVVEKTDLFVRVAPVAREEE